MSSGRPLRAAPNIKQVHLPGIYGDFRATIQSRITELATAKTPENLETIQFFEYLLSEVDAEEYRGVQARYVQKPNGMTKYLDPITWFESKLRVARRLALHSEAPLRILDIGAGPGHFPVVGRFYGHDVIGTDLPEILECRDRRGQFYAALCNVYRVKRVSHMIRPCEPLGDLGGRYDMVTAFLAAFNITEDKKPWSVHHWQFFLDSLRRDVLSEKGVLFMMLADEKLTEETWAYLKSLADWSVDRSKQVFISAF
jgi:hypothetical protein